MLAAVAARSNSAFAKPVAFKWVCPNRQVMFAASGSLMETLWLVVALKPVAESV